MKIYILILVFILTSCVTIYNKKKVMDINDIGLTKNELRLDGYYYQKEIFQSHPYKLSGNVQIIDTSQTYEQIRILPCVLYSDGSVSKLGSYSGVQDINAFRYDIKCSFSGNNTFDSAMEYFECYFKNMKERNNRKSSIWDQGVYKVDGEKITLQIFYNVWGNYYLYEERGRILNDTTFILNHAIDYQNGETYDIKEQFYFKKMDSMPKIESYIMNHKKKFD